MYIYECVCIIYIYDYIYIYVYACIVGICICIIDMYLCLCLCKYAGTRRTKVALLELLTMNIFGFCLCTLFLLSFGAVLYPVAFLHLLCKMDFDVCFDVCCKVFRTSGPINYHKLCST